MAERKIIDPGWSWDDSLYFSQAVRVGDLLFIAGQVAINTNGEIVGKNDIIAQTTQIFKNLAAILERAGGTIQNIVELTGFITDAEKIPEVRDMLSTLFPKDFPARTMVVVKALAHENLMLEIRAVAAL
jgi:reactive intermediate/imine deaminase